jgi:hypothetical protein
MDNLGGYEMNIKSQLVASWIGVISLAFFGLAFLPFASFLLIMPPALTPAEVAAYFQQHTNGIRFGMILMNIAGAMFCVLIAGIATQLRRIEKANPVWTYSLLVTGAAGATILIIGGMVMTAVAFRPERSPELIYLMYDLAWLFIIMPVTPFAMMAFVIGFAIVSDKGSPPVFPRWVGFFNIWTGLVFLPGLLCTFFKTGPFAWDGFFAFYLPGGLFGAWFIIMFVMVRKAIRQQE